MEIEPFLKQVYLTVTLVSIVVTYFYCHFIFAALKSEEDIPIYLGNHHLVSIAWLLSIFLTKLL